MTGCKKREMKLLTLDQWKQVGEHHRSSTRSLIRIGNALRAMKAPATPKRKAIQLEMVAWDKHRDLAIDLDFDATRQMGINQSGAARLLADDPDPVAHWTTDRKLVMTRHRWIELGDEMRSCLRHTQDLVILVGTSIRLARADCYARQVRRLEKLRSALDDLVITMDPAWGYALDVFYRVSGDDGEAQVRTGLGPVDPHQTIAAFFEPQAVEEPAR